MGWLFRNPRTQQERRINGSREYRRVEIEVGGEVQEFRIRIRGKKAPGCSCRRGTTCLPEGSGAGKGTGGRSTGRGKPGLSSEVRRRGPTGEFPTRQAARTTNRLPLLLDGERRVDVDDGGLEVGGCLGMVGAGLAVRPAGLLGLTQLGVRVRLAFVDRRLGGDNRGSRSHARPHLPVTVCPAPPSPCGPPGPPRRGAPDSRGWPWPTTREPS